MQGKPKFTTKELTSGRTVQYVNKNDLYTICNTAFRSELNKQINTIKCCVTISFMKNLFCLSVLHKTFPLLRYYLLIKQWFCNGQETLQSEGNCEWVHLANTSNFLDSNARYFLSTLKKPSKNYTCFILRRFRSFLIHLQSKNK